MCYKVEEQKKSELKLIGLFEQNEVPKFIQPYFNTLGSSTSKLNYWSSIYYLLKWLMEQNVLECKSFKDITPEQLNKVTGDDIIQYLDTLINGLWGNKISDSSAENKKNIFSGFWSWMASEDHKYVQRNIITSNGFDKYKTKNRNQEVSIPTDEGLQMFLENLSHIKNEFVALRNTTIVKLFIGSGMRIEELVGIDVSDLHFENEEDPYIMVMEKGVRNEKNKINVYISQVAYNSIREYLDLRNSIPDMKDLKPLFVSERVNEEDRRLAKSSIQDFFRKYSDGQIHPHMLRHYVGTKMYENTHNIVAVCDQLRHGDINVTKKYYIKNNREESRKALNSF